MEYYVGLDVSLRSCAFCIVDSKGKVYLEREFRVKPRTLRTAWTLLNTLSNVLVLKRVP